MGAHGQERAPDQVLSSTTCAAAIETNWAPTWKMDARLCIMEQRLFMSFLFIQFYLDTSLH